jgi:hypothetical protein
VVTAANIADSAALPDLLHGDETKVWGDQAYRGQSEAIREGAPRAQDLTNQRYRYKNRLDEVERENLTIFNVGLLRPGSGINDQSRSTPRNPRIEILRSCSHLRLS